MAKAKVVLAFGLRSTDARSADALTAWHQARRIARGDNSGECRAALASACQPKLPRRPAKAVILDNIARFGDLLSPFFHPLFHAVQPGDFLPNPGASGFRSHRIDDRLHGAEVIHQRLATGGRDAIRNAAFPRLVE